MSSNIPAKSVVVDPVVIDTLSEEPIRTPGYIQAHGALLVLQEPDLLISHVSDNSEQILGYSPQSLVGNSLETLLSGSQIAQFITALEQDTLASINPLKLSIAVNDSPQSFDGILSRTSDGLLLELEPIVEQNTSAFLDFYHLVSVAIEHIHQAANLQELCDTVAQEVRQLTGLDRVMIYRFNQSDNGTVIAEAKLADLPPFLGLNFPASDIPPQARELFFETGIRSVVDGNAPPAQLFPQAKELDLGHAVLRGVSPCHIQYLQNMAVCASLVIPLIHQGDLWGLIVCHHGEPKHFPYEVRRACRLMGQVMSLELSSQKNHTDHDYELQVNQTLAQLVEVLSATTNIPTTLLGEPKSLLTLTNATGVAIWQDEHYQSHGQVLEPEVMTALITKLRQDYGAEKVISSHCLERFGLDVPINSAIASGFLAISLSETRPYYIIWFRPEVIQTVNWAGDPSLQVEEQAEALILTPRKSFELWQELVQETCLPWHPSEISVALKLRKAVQRISLRRAEQLVKLNQALQASEARERERSTELAQTLEQLKQTHTQLVQSEKMSSLGQLVAGVAHEINNPVNFIYGNLVHTDRYVQDLIEILELYQKETPQPSAELQEQIEEVDLDFLLEDLPKILQSMRVGANRIQAIVKSLRNFSRLDESDKKTVDIHEGIDSTLVILGNRLKDRYEHPAIQVVKDYGDLPSIDCYPGPLNQVLMNLLVNAMDALDERDEGRSLAEIKKSPSTITISTRQLTEQENKQVQIQIQDNGSGIAPKHLDSIFDPFFTTKPIGQGTGMGLAISYQIITEKHAGTLTCESEISEGTTFTVTLPCV